MSAAYLTIEKLIIDQIIKHSSILRKYALKEITLYNHLVYLLP